MSNDDSSSSLCPIACQRNGEIGRCEIGRSITRPLNEADSGASKIFVKPRIEILFRSREAIKIEVEQV